MPFEKVPQARVAFLNGYLKADADPRSAFYDKALELFTPGQFAVIAVRLNSLEVLELGMANLMGHLSSSHDHHSITELKLLYHSARLLNQEPDTYLQNQLSKTSDAWARSFLQGFLSQPEAEKLNSGLKAVHDPGFGYIKEQEPHTTSVPPDSGKGRGWRFLSRFRLRK